jgi:SAM-dependent methyltransferase
MEENLPAAPARPQSLKKALSYFLRRSGLIGLSDLAKYRVQKARMRQSNQAFIREHPGVALPPPYLVFESYALDYRSYFREGLDGAKFITAALERHRSLTGASLLDWGCGPARVVRHLPGLLAGRDCRIFGSDYNRQSIEWCRANIPGVTFKANGSEPPLDFPDQSLDALYGISVFTHLSAAQHEAWARELGRVLRPGGVAFLSTHGALFLFNLMPWEKREFENGNLVTRGHAKEGHRTYTSFQPPAFMKKLFAGAGLDVLEHREGGPGSTEFTQDVWIVKKPGGSP